MKKLILFAIPALVAAAFTSCQDDKDPVLDTNQEFEFVLNTPPLANQFIDLATEGTLEFTLSQPSYGITLAPTYNLEISLTEDFTPLFDEPVVDSEGEEHEVAGSYLLTLEGSNKGVLSASMADIANGVNELNGIFDADMYQEDYVGPVFVRATASVGDGYSSELTAVTSNVVTLTQVKGYYIEVVNDLTLCVPGNGNGWNNSPDVPALVSDDGGLTYKGFAYIDKGFKITDGDWGAPTNWGAGDAGEGSVEGLLYDPETGTYSGPLIENGGNLNDTGEALEAGMYYIEVTVINMDTKEDGEQGGTITLTPITSIVVQGAYCDWSFDGAIEMEVSGSSNAVFTATGNFTADGWKFAMNGAWDINLGGDVNKLTFNGSDIKEDATTITLNLEQYPWTCTFE